MKKVLYVGHVYHKKTKSAGFVQELLKEKYELYYFYDDPQSAARFEELAELPVREFDMVVMWQVMPSVKEMKKYISFKTGIFFPMYDYYAGCTPLSNPIWNEYRNFTIINFSRAMYRDLRKAGFDARYLQYFPKPAETFDPENSGDPEGLYFWQRVTKLNIFTVYNVFNKFPLKKLHIHKVLDPAERFTEVPTAENDFCSWYFKGIDISESTWYDTREEMKKDIEAHALYFAPRFHEGIGMSFLEAMAMGRCVVAPDYPTMNEYIRHGENGFLYDGEARKPLELTAEQIRTVQKNAYEYIKAGYQRWEADKYKIFDWVEAACNKKEKKTVKELMSAFFVKICPNSLFDTFQAMSDELTGRLFYWSTTSCRLFGIVPVIKIKRVDTRRMKLYIFGVPVWESIVADNRTPWEE